MGDIGPQLLTSSSTGTFYFAYGSNLSYTQMRRRCYHNTQSSKPCAIARLDHYSWIICQRGYANVVDHRNPSRTSQNLPSNTPNPSTTVYGLVYNMAPADEVELDRYEGHNQYRNPHPTPNPDPDPEKRREVPELQGDWDYNKHYLKVTITKWLDDPAAFGLTSPSSNTTTLDTEIQEIRVLVYVDELRTKHGTINDEYIGRMNRGIREAVSLGLPEDWVDKVMRDDIPREGREASPTYVGTAEGYVEKAGAEAGE